MSKEVGVCCQKTKQTIVRYMLLWQYFYICVLFSYLFYRLETSLLITQDSVNLHPMTDVDLDIPLLKKLYYTKWVLIFLK